MLVAYSVSTLSTYAGVISLTPNEYQKFNKLEEKELGEHIMEKIQKDNSRESCLIECVSHFAPV